MIKNNFNTSHKEKTKSKNKEDTISLLANEMELFVDPYQEAYAKIRLSNHVEVYKIRSWKFGNWIRSFLYNIKNELLNSNKLKDIIGSLEAKAIFTKNKLVEKVFIRIGELNDKVYLDIGDETWKVVEICKKRIQLLEKSPVNFFRPEGLLPLPNPEMPEKYSKKKLITYLKRCLNLDSKKNSSLISGWLLGSLNPRGPYPIFCINGEQGSGKSFMAKTLQKIIDPNEVELMGRISNEKTLMVNAKNSWVLGFDNISSLKQEVSDCLCRISTGIGIGTRKLYTDDQRHSIKVSRPIILNGITEFITAPDLLERTIIVNVPRIEKNRRLTEHELLSNFKKVHPKIIGQLLSGIQESLNNYNKIDLSNLPRMADFAKWVEASECNLEDRSNSFLETYDVFLNENIIDNLNNDDVALVLIHFMKIYFDNVWEGTATELLKGLNETKYEISVHEYYWPKNANTLSKKLNKLSTFFREASILEITRTRDNKGNRIIIIRKMASMMSDPFR